MFLTLNHICLNTYVHLGIFLTLSLKFTKFQFIQGLLKQLYPNYFPCIKSKFIIMGQNLIKVPYAKPVCPSYLLMVFKFQPNFFSFRVVRLPINKSN